MSSSDLYIAATVFAALIAAAALLFARRSAQAAEADTARDEAVDLADIRGKMNDELRARLDQLEKDAVEDRDAAARKVEELRQTIDLVREESAESQRLFVVGMRGVLVKVLNHLETEPPETDEAIRYLRDTLSQEAPPPPSPFRLRRHQSH